MDLDKEDINSDDILKSVNRFEPDFRITNALNEDDWWTAWEGQFNRNNGISGLYWPNFDLMVVENRTMMHHNGQIDSIQKRFDNSDKLMEDEVMPWAVDRSMGGWACDIARSAGGLFQIISRQDLDLKRLSRGLDTDEDYMWPVIYTCWLLDVPEETETTFKYEPRRLQDLGPEYDTFQQEDFEMGAAYRELRFALGDMPEKKINRNPNE